MTRECEFCGNDAQNLVVIEIRHHESIQSDPAKFCSNEHTLCLDCWELTTLIFPYTEEYEES